MRSLLVGNMGLLERLISGVPLVRRLAEENARLRREVLLLETGRSHAQREAAKQLDQLETLRETSRQHREAQQALLTSLSGREAELRQARQRIAEFDQRILAANAETQGQEQRADSAEAALTHLAPDLWVPPGHFYSPLVDPSAGTVRRAIAEEANPTHQPADLGVDAELMFEWFHRMAEEYREEPFSKEPVEGRLYHYDNPHFPLADALALLTFLKRCGTRRYLEIGAGFSSCAAIDIGENHLPQELQFTFIEPFPELAFQLLGENSPYRHRVIPSRLQDLPLEIFRSLDRNDVLFIDSSHIAKTGSDVLDYLFRILPALKPGVLVHIHDIFFPFEYPGLWIVDQNRSWNEAYFLRAFLHGNAGFRVLFWNDWFFKCQRELVLEQMPLCVEFRGGSLWLEALDAGTGPSAPAPLT